MATKMTLNLLVLIQDFEKDDNHYHQLLRIMLFEAIIGGDRIQIRTTEF